MTVYENLKRLSYDLNRAEERARHTQAVKDDIARKHRIYAENVQRVKGEADTAFPLAMNIAFAHSVNNLSLS
jgi:hypothetical protein